MIGVEYDKKLVSTKGGCIYNKSSHLITSGSSLNLEIFKKIGVFDEQLFIDNVDHEYCFRAIVKGYEIAKLNNILLNHSLGTLGFYRSLKNLKRSPRALHSPLRIYYMVRNYFYLKRRYVNVFKTEINTMRKSLLNRIKNGLLYGDKKLLLLKNIYRGYLHYKQGKMGKLNE